MPSQALADTLLLAPASLLQGNQNSSSDGGRVGGRLAET